MHLAVQLDSINRLPPSIRRFAAGACKENRSADDVGRARDFMRSRRLPDAQTIAFLPAFFVNLDPTGIPTSEELEVFEPRTRDAVSRAVISLDAISRIYHLPLAVGVSLWPRVWPWTQFIDTYWEQLPGVSLPEELTFYLNFIKVCGQFHDHPATYSLISSTPGFWTMIARVWTFVPEVVPAIRREGLLSDLGGFIADSNPSNPDHFSELIEGAGGTVEHLALLVVEYMQDVAGRSNPAINGSPAIDISRLIDFLKEVDLYPGSSSVWMTAPLSELLEAMLAKGSIDALIAVMLTLIQKPISENGEPLKACFTLLERLLASAPGYTWLEEALYPGLLQVIVQCAILDYDGQLYSHLRNFLAQLIPQGLVFFHNVLQVESAISDVRDLTDNATFERCKLSSDWHFFVGLASDRALILPTLQDTASSKACDNLQTIGKCPALGLKTRFRRCSGCKTFYYCNEECQKLDWQNGHHRSACRKYKSLSLTTAGSALALVRDRDFVRVLLHHDYEANVYAIHLAHIKFMIANPTCPLFLTLFDYCSGRVKIQVLDATEASPTIDLLRSEEWDDLVSRARRSMGRMHLHVIKIVLGTSRRCWVVPQRTSHSGVHDTLRALARTFNVDAPEAQIVAAIDSLDAEDIGDVATY
ncbi:hypothetical protein DFH06DRAFT_1125488 [Mycena polygramma]|nr:hypothetical protein DFH06DRAFT_1125488 [Mycena polygramma]